MARRRPGPTSGAVKKVGFDFRLLPAQREFWGALDAGKRFVAYVGGIRGGKTYVGARRALYEAVKRGGVGWIISPTYPMSDIPKREFEEVLALHPQLVAQHRDHPAPYWRLATKNGAEIEVRSGEFPDRLRGPGLSWVWIDEGALLDGEAWRILLGRVLDTRGVMFVTTTPKGRNWVYEEFMVGQHPDYAVVTSKTSDNVFLPADALKKLTTRYGGGTNWARQELEAEFVAFEGLVYPEFDLDTHVQVPPARETFREVVAGLDWGYNDPTACVAVGRSPDRTWWVLDEVYDTHLSPSEVVRDVSGFCRQYGVHRLWADPSRPDLIEELRRARIPVLAARPCKPLTLGVSRVAGLLKEDRVRVSPVCRWLISEFGTYAFKRVVGTDRAKGGEVPDDKCNHALDALRYVLWSMEPVTPDPWAPRDPIRIPQPTLRT